MTRRDTQMGLMSPGPQCRCLRGGRTEPSRRVSSAVLRGLLVVAFALVALFVSRSAAAATPLDVVESASAVRLTAEHPQAVSPLTGDGDRDAVEEAVDDDGIDDDDVEGRFRAAVCIDAAVAIRFASSPRPTFALHTEPQRDPSLFAIGTGFARGPPY